MRNSVDSQQHKIVLQIIYISARKEIQLHRTTLEHKWLRSSVPIRSRKYIILMSQSAIFKSYLVITLDILEQWKLLLFKKLLSQRIIILARLFIHGHSVALACVLVYWTWCQINVLSDRNVADSDYRCTCAYNVTNDKVCRSSNDYNSTSFYFCCALFNVH